MAQAISTLIESFGGVRPMARALGLQHTPATVQYWKTSGYLPRSRRDAVETALCAGGMAPSRAKRLVNEAVLGAQQECRTTLAVRTKVPASKREPTRKKHRS